MTMVDDYKVTEFQIIGLKKARNILREEVKGIQNEICPPWRERGEDWVDRESAAKQAVENMTQEIIALERSLRDPIQDAEMQAELYASGVPVGEMHLYMHTPEEEDRFQQQIHDDIEYGYYDPEDGWVDGISGHERPGKCYCGVTTWDDDCYNVQGWFMCLECSEDATAFMHFVALATFDVVVDDYHRYGEPEFGRVVEEHRLEREEIEALENQD